jgi:cytoskeletal protein CcmA (bactofilin family)
MWPFRDAPSAFPSFKVENTIAAGARVRGDLSGAGGFRVDGAVGGAIDADGPVIIGEQGSVEGHVRGRDVVVLGRVRGDVRTSGHLEIGPKGKVLGDITVQSLRLHKGGVFRGASNMASGEASGEETQARPALAIRVDADVPRGRTLPPPNGAVPPPSTLSELAFLPALPAEALSAASEERLIVSDEDSDAGASDTTPARRSRANGA